MSIKTSFNDMGNAMGDMHTLTGFVDELLQWKDRPFLIGRKGYRTDVWTYRDVWKGIQTCTAMLEAQGFSEGHKALILLPPSPEWVVAFFSVLMRGGVVVPLETSSTSQFVQAVCEKTGPTLFFTARELTGLERRAVSITISMASLSGCRDGETQPAAPLTSPGDGLAEIVFTSGTTSRPKGVMLSHKNILSTVNPIRTGIETHKLLVTLFPRIHMVCTVPYTHMFGQVTGILLPILLGSTVYIADDTSPASLIRDIKRQRAITLITVPRVLKLLAEHARQVMHTRGSYGRFIKHWENRNSLPYPLRVFSFLDLHRIMGLRFWSFIVGGSALDPETHEFWRRTVFAVFQGYGLTETAPIVTMFNPFKHPRDSVGSVMPGQEIKLAPDGEILVRGENVMQGYYQDTEATDGVISDGWFHTGDIGERDEQGRIFIRGRKKEMILTSDGHNVYPLDVEHALAEQEGVRECVVFGKPGPSGESVHAVLLLKPGFNAACIVQGANDILDSHQRIRDYSVWEAEDFPRTATMKVRKVEVMKRVLDGRSPEQDRDNVFHGITAGIPDEAARLSEDLGLDSLDVVELVCRMEKRYGISLDETVIGPDTTVADILSLASGNTRGHREGAVRHRPLSMPRWTRRTPVRFLRSAAMNGTILPLFRLFCKLDVQGFEKLAMLQEPVILCANHQSDMDPLAVLLALPTRYRKLICPAMGLNRFNAHFQHLGRMPQSTEYSKNRQIRKSRLAHKNAPNRSIKGLFHGIGYTLLTFLFQTFPFPQGSAFRRSLEYTGELIDAGLSILIFPEGRVSVDGSIGMFKAGVSLIAEMTDVPVVPVHINGMHDVLPPQHWFPHRGYVQVTFGSSLRYNRQGHEQFTRTLEDAVRSMEGNNIKKRKKD